MTGQGNIRFGAEILDTLLIQNELACRTIWIGNHLHICHILLRILCNGRLGTFRIPARIPHRLKRKVCINPQRDANPSS